MKTKKKPNTKGYRLYEPIYGKFKRKENKSPKLVVRIAVSFVGASNWEKGGWSINETASILSLHLEHTPHVKAKFTL